MPRRVRMPVPSAGVVPPVQGAAPPPALKGIKPRGAKLDVARAKASAAGKFGKKGAY